MKKRLLLLCCTVLFITSCATTEVINTWKEESQTEKYTTIFVFGLAKKPVYRSLLERQLVNLLKDAGVEAHTTYDLFPNIGSIDRAAAAAVIKGKGGDGVMVIRLIDKKEETIHLRSSTFAPAGSVAHDGMGWYGYLVDSKDPAVDIDQKISLVESTIFNVDKKKRVWSATTKTTEDSIPASIYSYRDAIGKQLKSSGLF